MNEEPKPRRWENMPEVIEYMAREGYRPTGLWRALDTNDELLAETSRPQDFDDLKLPEDTTFLQEFKKVDFQWLWKLPQLEVKEQDETDKAQDR